ncbi:Phosphoenolpyruvate synthase [Enhygromyxa salina]|uniref:Phosphoenolpyruvate synthase n=1 Tax=Enhygromyxa salina TaxID=215803 RepID=A0A2S9XJ02_9BACT|nr:PEP/pyruvate-binding domain-containing protein [Enhygromyxa salina]PRP92817.1 Phosphoenolpyruvate synthase [Enhygromyxa salina]
MQARPHLRRVLLSLSLAPVLLACRDPGPEAQVCAITDQDPDSSQTLGCREDFDRLAAKPLNSAKVNAYSAKTLVDTFDDQLYVQNSDRYPIHWDFAFEHLSGQGKPIVPQLGDFNQSEYYSPGRRFYLGAITYYEGPDKWTYEISPYDTASAKMIAAAYAKIRDNSFFGERLYFHPTSEAVEHEAEELPEWVKVITTEALYADQEVQILNTGETYAKLVFVSSAELDSAYLGFRDLVVLDKVPNDISVVSGIITEAFQTPLSHINVLSQSRGTPNIALAGAWTDEELRALEGEWVRFVVTADDWTIEEVSAAQAEAWWQEHRPAPLGVPAKDLSVQALTDIEELLDPMLDDEAAIDAAVPAFGGKASNYAVLAKIGANLNPPKAFAVPIYFYDQFLVEHGFDVRIAQLLADDSFRDDAQTRDTMLASLRDDMVAAPLNAEFEAAVLAKLDADYPGLRMRFRSSTNAEDLEGFTGAGLYTSKSGYAMSAEDPFQAAIKQVWASVWSFRAFEEREYRGIEHTAVGMALLVHRSFPDEEANGVALTANIFDQSGAEPGFYINVQEGGASVVKPSPGVSTDQLIYHFDFPGQPVVYIAHSNLVAPGEKVLTNAELYELGTALDAIHSYFAGIYPPNEDGWYAMDVEFKFDDVDEFDEPVLWVKQARPHPGLGD